MHTPARKGFWPEVARAGDEGACPDRTTNPNAHEMEVRLIVESSMSENVADGLGPGTYLVTVYTHTSPDVCPVIVLIDDRATYGQAVVQRSDLPVVEPLESSRVPHLIEYAATSARQVGQQAYTRIAAVAHSRKLNDELEHPKAAPLRISDEVLHLAGDLLAICWAGSRALGISDLHWGQAVSLPSVCLDVALARIRGVREHQPHGPEPASDESHSQQSIADESLPEHVSEQSSA